MATPVGHVLAGYAVYNLTTVTRLESRPMLIVVCLGLAVFPDLDFLPGIFYGQPALYHQGITHSLGMAIGVSLAVVLIYDRSRSTFLGHWKIFTLAYSSHLMIDLLGPDRRPPLGIPLLWPLVGDYYQAPVQIFLGVHHANRTSATLGEWMMGIMNPLNLGAMGIEVLVLLPLVFITKYFRHGRD